MVEITRYHLPSVVLLVLALAFFGLAVQSSWGVVQPGYTYSVHHLDGSDDPLMLEMDVTNVSDLSPEARHGVLAAIRSTDHRVTRWGRAQKAPEFTYRSDAFDPGDGLYLVRHDGELYRLRTIRAGGQSARTNLALAFLLTLLALAVAADSFRQTRPRGPLVFLAAVAGLLVWWRSRVYTLTPETGGLEIVLGVLFVALPAAGTWYLLGKTEYWAGRRRTDRGRDSGNGSA